MDIANEPACIVDGLSHAWVPLNPGNDATKFARCGRCDLKRTTDPDGTVSYWRPSKLQPQE